MLVLTACLCLAGIQSAHAGLLDGVKKGVVSVVKEVGGTVKDAGNAAGITKPNLSDCKTVNCNDRMYNQGYCELKDWSKVKITCDDYDRYQTEVIESLRTKFSEANEKRRKMNSEVDLTECGDYKNWLETFQYHEAGADKATREFGGYLNELPNNLYNGGVAEFIGEKIETVCILNKISYFLDDEEIKNITKKYEDRAKSEEQVKAAKQKADTAAKKSAKEAKEKAYFTECPQAQGIAFDCYKLNEVFTNKGYEGKDFVVKKDKYSTLYSYENSSLVFNVFIDNATGKIWLLSKFWRGQSSDIVKDAYAKKCDIQFKKVKEIFGLAVYSYEAGGYAAEIGPKDSGYSTDIIAIYKPLSDKITALIDADKAAARNKEISAFR